MAVARWRSSSVAATGSRSARCAFDFTCPAYLPVGRHAHQSSKLRTFFGATVRNASLTMPVTSSQSTSRSSRSCRCGTWPPCRSSCGRRADGSPTSRAVPAPTVGRRCRPTAPFTRTCWRGSGSSRGRAGRRHWVPRFVPQTVPGTRGSVLCTATCLRPSQARGRGRVRRRRSRARPGISPARCRRPRHGGRSASGLQSLLRSGRLCRQD